MNVLAVGAHHDDIELACAGTLATLKLGGSRLFGAVLTDSVTHYDALNIHRDKQDVKAEHSRAVDVIGLEMLPGFEWCEVGALAYNTQKMRQLEEVIDRERISLVLMHWSGDANMDHRAAAQLCLAASRRVGKVLSYRSNWYATETVFNPNFYVDISHTMQTKRRALECYQIEIRNRGRHWIDSFASMNQVWGQAIGVDYAEAFEVIRWTL